MCIASLINKKGAVNKFKCPPVKVAALDHDLPVYQPVTLRDEQVESRTRSITTPDVVIVVRMVKFYPLAYSIAAIWLY